MSEGDEGRWAEAPAAGVETASAPEYEAPQIQTFWGMIRMGDERLIRGVQG